MENCVALPPKITKKELSYDPQISLSEIEIISKRYLETHVHSCIIHDSQWIEASQVSSDV